MYVCTYACTYVCMTTIRFPPPVSEPATPSAAAPFRRGGSPPNVVVQRGCAMLDVAATSQSASKTKPSGLPFALPRSTQPPPGRGLISRTTWPQRQSASGGASSPAAQPRSSASLAPANPISPPMYLQEGTVSDQLWSSGLPQPAGAWRSQQSRDAARKTRVY